jgi:hypothetical protein
MILGRYLHEAVRQSDDSRTINVVHRSPRNQLFRDRSTAGSFERFFWEVERRHQ